VLISGTLLPEQKTSATPSSSDLDCVIRFGHTSRRSASCVSISSPLSEASATFALDFGEWFSA
jgi:hypothetical protein